MWEKTDVILDTKAIQAFSTSHAAIPFAHRLANGQYKLFFASRDARSRSHIYSASLNFSGNTPTLDTQSIRQVLGLGSIGAFDDSGVMPSWLIEENGQLFMYYTGWSLGQTVPFYFYIGLAKSGDGGQHFERVSKAPILGRNTVDPYLTASACVLKEGATWRMWYVSGKGWEQQESGLRHYYFIRHAHSADGIHWTPHETPCIDFASQDEYAMARPCVVAVEGGYLMWYAYRGISYRFGLAASRDGLHWTRVDDKAGIDVSAAGWDAEMIEYGHVFREGDHWWMLYNGNGYGESGIGLAKTKQLPALSELLR